MEVAEYERMYRLEESHWWFRQRLDLVLRLMRRYAPATSSVLDIGCGTGLVAQALNRLGHDVTGVDVAPEAIAFCRQRGLPHLYQEELGALSLPESSYDVALALDVLEHVEDDDAGFEDLVRVLKVGGVGIITVPAYPWLWSGHDERLHHYRRYTKKSLLKLIHSEQLVVIRLSYTNLASLLPALIVRPWQRRQGSAGSNLELSLNTYASFVFMVKGWLENRWLESCSLPVGLSMLAVVRKVATRVSKDGRTSSRPILY